MRPNPLSAASSRRGLERFAATNISSMHPQGHPVTDWKHGDEQDWQRPEESAGPVPHSVVSYYLCHCGKATMTIEDEKKKKKKTSKIKKKMVRVEASLPTSCNMVQLV